MGLVEVSTRDGLEHCLGMGSEHCLVVGLKHSLGMELASFLNSLLMGGALSREGWNSV